MSISIRSPVWHLNKSACFLCRQFSTTRISTSASVYSRHYVPLPGEVGKFLNQHKIFKSSNYLNGHDTEFTVKCPNCHGKKSRWATLHLNRHTGKFRCEQCATKGTWPDYTSMILKSSNIDSISKLSTNNNKVTGPSRSPIEIEKFKNDLWKNQDIVKWLSGDMGIKPEVLEAYQVGIASYTSHDVNRKKSSKQICITFPRTGPDYSEATADTDTKWQTTRIKACLPYDYDQVYTYDPMKPSSAEPGLFGYHVASINSTKIVLCHDEFDAMSVYQSTGIPSMSLPESYYQLTPDVTALLERFTQIYIWMPDDLNGQEASASFAQKLGLERCQIVTTRVLDAEGPTRPHDSMMAGKNLNEAIQRAKPLGHEQIVDFNILRDAVYRELANPDQLAGVQLMDFPQFNQIIKGHRRGELSIWTGPTGVGKTTVLSQLSLDLCKNGGVSTLWGSFEIPLTRFSGNMLKQFAEKDLSNHINEYQIWADQFEQLPMYFLKYFGSTEVEELLGVLAHAHHVYDIQHVIIDNLQFMLSGQGVRGEKWDIQDNVISALRSFATSKNVHISLVVHPRKENPKENLTLQSVFGSAKVTQEADNVIIVQNVNDEIRMLDVQKNRFDGTRGTVYCRFDKPSLKLCELAVVDEEGEEQSICEEEQISSQGELCEEEQISNQEELNQEEQISNREEEISNREEEISNQEELNDDKLPSEEVEDKTSVAV